MADSPLGSLFLFIGFFSRVLPLSRFEFPATSVLDEGDIIPGVSSGLFRLLLLEAPSGTDLGFPGSGSKGSNSGEGISKLCDPISGSSLH